MPITPKDLIITTQNAVFGKLRYGKGLTINMIARQIVDDNPHIDLNDIIQDFEEYWYSKMLMDKYNDKYKPATYIIMRLFYFILDYKKKMETNKALLAIHRPLPALELHDGDMVKSEGTWRQYNITTDFNISTCSGVENEYLSRELIELIEDFTLEEYGDTYLALFHGEITQSEAAERIGCSRRWVIEKWKDYQRELVAYLIDNGYSADDVDGVY